MIYSLWFITKSSMFCVYILDGTLNSDLATQALRKCTSAIVESAIEPIALARRLYEEEVISEGVYRTVKDRNSGANGTECLELILDDVKGRIKLDTNAFMTFLDILRGDSLNRQDLANKIMLKYKDIIQ